LRAIRNHQSEQRTSTFACDRAHLRARVLASRSDGQRARERAHTERARTFACVCVQESARGRANFFRLGWTLTHCCIFVFFEGGKRPYTPVSTCEGKI